ncbi:MAG: LemA family protein [Bacilli bacterium]|nr:LemA family protein [Bacilli bacterium]
MWVYILIGFVSFLIFYFIFLINFFIKWSNKVKEAFSTMDVYFKKRWDLIPNLVEVVKGYAKHESETLEEVIRLRSQSSSMDEEIKNSNLLNKKIRQIMILSENYPELKADEQFRNLISNLIKIEDELMNARKYYNAIVRIYNNKIEIFPNCLIAKLFGYSSKMMFEVSENEKELVKIEL